MKHIFLSSFFCLLFCLASCIFIIVGPDLFNDLYEIFKSIENMRHMIGFSMFLFGLLCLVFVSISCAIKTIYHLVAFCAIVIFGYCKTEEQICVNVDENCIVRGSFVELSNGKIIPIRLNKINWSKEDIDKINGSLGESNE